MRIKLTNTGLGKAKYATLEGVAETLKWTPDMLADFRLGLEYGAPLRINYDGQPDKDGEVVITKARS